MGVMPYHVRLAELTLIQKRRELTDREVMDMTHCLTANAEYCWDLIMLQNCSQVAYEAGDMEWLHAICEQLEALELGVQTKKKTDKSPPQS